MLNPFSLEGRAGIVQSVTARTLDLTGGLRSGPWRDWHHWAGTANWQNRLAGQNTARRSTLADVAASPACLRTAASMILTGRPDTRLSAKRTPR